MKVPYQLRPLPNAEPAVALLLPGRRADNVLRLCAALGLDPLPAIHRVADGFLVKLPQALDTPLAGVIRLRALSPDLLLPVDAELVPPLLPDEASALVSKRGLVFLPGGRVLEFRPDQPVPVAELVQVGEVRRLSWTALPEPPQLADDVTEIALDETDLAPDVVLEAGGEGVAKEDPQIPSSGLPSKVLGKTLFGLGKGFAWLGKSLHMPGLAGFGAKLLSGAMSLVPRLSEELLGKQEAMLRNLLREFREGNIEKALKRALPLGNDDSRGNVPAQNAHLPMHNLYYSLVNLLAGRGQGGPGWFTAGNTYYELMQEYRKQAEQAAARGDFRRAAFIFGKLLRDFRSAALVLARGGLHRDAAILYEKALQDPMAAAREWEAAGEIDRALRIYLKLGEHALAGDLLRRAGEEERAVAEYQQAAAKLVESAPRHYEAGELLANRAQRPDLALPYYRRGWQARPHGNAMACALELARHQAAAGECAALMELVGEADALLDPWDVESASTFYNELARLADRPKLRSVAADVRDHARLGLARKLAQSGGVRHGGNLIAALFPAESPWPAPLVRDADHALRQASRRAPSPVRPPWSLRRVRPSIVRAVHQLPATRKVFLGLENGEVICIQPHTGEIVTVAQEPGPILSLSSVGADEYIAVLSQVSAQRICLSILAQAKGYRMLNHDFIATDEPAWLCSGILNDPIRVLGVCVGRNIHIYRAPELVALRSITSAQSEDYPVAGVIGDLQPRGAIAVVLYPSHAECHSAEQQEIPIPMPLSWFPASDGVEGLRHPPLNAVWLDSDCLEITGLDSGGGIRVCGIRMVSGDLQGSTPGWASRKGPFRALCIRDDFFAGITPTGIHWLLNWRNKNAGSSETSMSFARPVAAFVLPAATHLLVVEADCTLTRVPIPDV